MAWPENAGGPHAARRGRRSRRGRPPPRTHRSDTAEVSTSSRLEASTSTPRAAAVVLAEEQQVERPGLQQGRDESRLTTNGAEIHTCAHVRESSPPIIQKTMSCATCQVTMLSEISRLDTAVRNAPTAMPASSSVVIGVDASTCSDRRTRAAAPAGLIRWMRAVTATTDVVPHPVTNTMTAPRTAPGPTPVRLGSASGFRKSALHHRAARRQAGADDRRHNARAARGSARRSLRRRA